MVEEDKPKLEGESMEDLEQVDFHKIIHEDEGYAGITHRLDKHTTGIMTLAKSKLFAREFSKLLKLQ